jgi:hypothetical protein
MAEHLRFEGSRIEPATPTGRFAIAILFLNHPAQVEYRDFVLRSIDRCLRERNAVQSTLAQLDARIAASQDLERRRMLADRSALHAWLERLRADLDRLTGSASPL